MVLLLHSGKDAICMKNNRGSSAFVKQLPNFITCLRLVGAICMLFTKALSTAFFVLYTVCGISDLIDGWLARKTGNTSEFGAKLDSIADLSFNAIMVLKTFPTLWKTLPIGIWITVGAIFAVRIVSYALVAIRNHSFSSLHTYMNKLTGFAVFTIPFYIKFKHATLFAIIGCIVAAVATLEELIIHLLNKDGECKTLLTLKFSK